MTSTMIDPSRWAADAIRAARLGSAGVRVVSALAEHADPVGVVAPSRRGLARAAGCGIGTAMSNVGRSIKSGWLERLDDPDRGRDQVRFRLTTPAPCPRPARNSA